MKTTITYKELVSLGACAPGLRKFLSAHGESPVKLSDGLKSNGWEDTWTMLSDGWQLLTKKQQDDLQLLGCDWAEKILVNFTKEFPDDKRPAEAIEAKRKYIVGEITYEELKSTRSVATWAVESARSAEAESADSAVKSAAWAAESADSAAWAAESAVKSAAWAAADSAAAESAYMEKCTKELLSLFKSWEAEVE